jgi:hypothetical protein
VYPAVGDEAPPKSDRARCPPDQRWLPHAEAPSRRVIVGSAKESYHYTPRPAEQSDRGCDSGEPAPVVSALFASGHPYCPLIFGRANVDPALLTDDSLASSLAVVQDVC